MNLSTKTILPFLLVCFSFYSCQKETDLETQGIKPVHKLETEDPKFIKVRQAIEINDGDALSDSADFVNPPTHRYYKWQILPDDNCVTLSGRHKYGRAYLTFNCPGKYQVSATVYDSATHELIATTDAMEIEVSRDTLYAAHALQNDEVLQLHATLAKSISDINKPATSLPNGVYIYMRGNTNKLYEYGNNSQINVDATSTNGNYSFAFSDSVKLTSYPFAPGSGNFNPVNIGLPIKGLELGVPANLNITWLGQTYTGKVTLINENRLSLDWDNSGHVKIN